MRLLIRRTPWLGLCFVLSCGCRRKSIESVEGPQDQRNDSHAAPSAIEAARLYRDRLKAGDIDAVGSMLASFPGNPALELDTKGVARLVRRYTKGGRRLEILDAKVEDEVAVVIVDDKGGVKAVDIDPLFLFRQKGEWKVFPDYRLVSQCGIDMPQSLGRWYSQRKDQLKQKLIGK